ncbi:hypothetical protein [Lysobacter terrae]
MANEQKRVLGRVLAHEEINTVCGGTLPNTIDGYKSDPTDSDPVGGVGVGWIDVVVLHNLTGGDGDFSDPAYDINITFP